MSDGRKQQSKKTAKKMDEKGWNVDPNPYNVIRAAERMRKPKGTYTFKNMTDSCLHAYRTKMGDKGQYVQMVKHNLEQYHAYYPTESCGRLHGESTRFSLMCVGPHANTKLRYEPPTLGQRLKGDDGKPLRAMAEKTAELCRNMLLR